MSELSPLQDPNALLRRIEGIERQLRELGPSVAKSASSIVSQLVAANAFNGGASGFSVPSGTSASVLNITVPVPLGYTQAAVIANGTVGGTNSSGSASYLYAGVDIGSITGGLNVNILTPNGSLGTALAQNAQVLTGLTPGGSFTIALRAKGDPAWGSSGTFAIASALVTYLR